MLARAIGSVFHRRLPQAVSSVNPVRHHVPMQPPCGTYDEILVPSGSWQEMHRKRNAFYNKFLLGASIVFVISATMAFRAAEMSKYDLPPCTNTPEGLKFLNPDKEALKYVLEN
ncbi:uncharacterized protein DEA37_0003244 [Paragonimus westermani]|uniref:Deltamethrin resistance protein prag01 domain-containing protein n=1 Tax=Paragonimus westermani TaxID=34504 RepID=A0A5J4NYL7_9TREM|nr:uncharacterized protein DEA37_0003244 [Paragonimus westermani]